MAGSSAKRRSGARWVFVAVAVTAVVLGAALSAAWVYLAGELDRRVASAIEAAGGRGVTVSCADREVFGYPFRLGLSCSAVTIDAPERSLTAEGGALRTAAQIYDPAHIVAELAAPVAVSAPDLPPLDLLWTLGQASARFGFDGLGQLSVALDQPAVRLRDDGAEVARAERLEGHARRNGSDLDLALVDTGIVLLGPGGSPLPTFDLSGDGTVVGAAGWLNEGLPGGRLEEALRGSSGTLRQLRLALPAGGAAEISGPFEISGEGEITGDFAVALEEPDAIAALAGTLLPGAASIANTLVGALGFVGRVEDGRTILDVEIRDGRARIGFVPLGRIPPI